MRWSIMLAAYFVTGCASLSTVAVNFRSDGQFDKASRPEVWGRALTAMQIRGMVVSRSDAVGGLLQSEIQARSMECGNNAYGEETDWGKRPGFECSVWSRSQVTVSPDGTAFVSTRMSFTAMTEGGKPPITVDDRQALQAENDALLDFIIGRSKASPVPFRVPEAPGGTPPRDVWGGSTL